jgi:hypothetical protein
MGASSFRGAVPVAAIVGLLFAAASASAAGTASGAHSARNHRIRHGASTNWSGYALTGPGPYDSVSSSWTQPAVNCAVTRSGYSAFWVGLDGYTTETVEQTGTEADCSNGKPVYGAWYEMFPRGSVGIAEPVAPGDSFTASVTYLGKAFFGLTSKFELTLSDTTQGWSRSETKYLRRGDRRGPLERLRGAAAVGLRHRRVQRRDRQRLAGVRVDAGPRTDHDGVGNQRREGRTVGDQRRQLLRHVAQQVARERQHRRHDASPPVQAGGDAHAPRST